jgi:hypothetical protein
VPTKHQFTGMTGLYVVAAELSKRGFIVSPTSRSVQTADLLIADPPCQNVYAVQVKTNASTFGFWLVSAKTANLKSRNLVYALVNLRKSGTAEIYLVPSAIVAKRVRFSPKSLTRKVDGYSVYLKDIAKYKDRWVIFKRASLEQDSINATVDALHGVES